MLDILVLAILIAISAFFSAAEFALVRVRRSRIQQLVDEGNSGALRVQRVTSQPGRFLAVIQVGVTFVSVLAGSFAGANLVQGLAGTLATLPVVGPYALAIAFVVVTVLVAISTIVLGELTPKTVALAYSERLAIFFAGPIELIAKILRPVVWLLTGLTRIVTTLLRVPETTTDKLTAEELMIIVERGGEQGVIEAEEQQMIGAVLELGEQRVHEVMVPRIDIKAAPATATLEEMIEVIVSEGHSRIPVYDESIDNVIGILYAKDLLPVLAKREQPDIRTLLRTPQYVPESITVDDLLHQFQRSKVHIAIVLDEYGGTAGMVTIEDLIEEIVGEIQDEYDVEEEPMIVPLSDNEARVDGRASVDDLGEHFGIELDGADSDEYDTVGGLVYHAVGGVPDVGAVVEVDGLTLTVETTDGRRVGKVLVVRRTADEQEAAAAAES
jgi:putative hemolysin